MGRFLDAAEGHSDEEVADASGINRESVRLYREGKWQRLYARTRRRMEDYIGAHPKHGGRGFTDGMEAAAKKMEDALAAIRSAIAARKDAEKEARSARDRRRRVDELLGEDQGDATKEASGGE